MIRSMTAFARVEQQEPWGQLCWELRSVNHRYLETSIRLPEDFRRLEVTIRERLQQHLKRGKIDGSLYFQINKDHQLNLKNVNLSVVQQLWQAMQAMNGVTGYTTPPTALEMLRWPGVLETNILDQDQVSEGILQLFDTVLSQLLTQREREGAQLATLMEQRCLAIAKEVEYVRNELPSILQAQRERLQQRLIELTEQVNANSERLEQEMVILANKMDVSEELERLEAHLEEARQMLSQAPATGIGRRLDFLVQELHREANTLGAKANHINTTRHVVELKVLIEQMREQTQNIE
jgi:uncharacterized protein (TIGR00255 family)